MAGLGSKALGFGDPGSRIKFNGKEEQRKEFNDGSGLEWLDYGARMYDNQIGRWLAQDQMSYKYLALSQYDFVGSNPIMRVDPDGKDWYKDEKGIMQFDPKIQSQKDLNSKQKYIGDFFQEKNKKGAIIADFRKDGSILFSKQKDAYARMINNSSQNGNREEFGALLKGGKVLVTPDYKNLINHSEPDKYGFNWKKGNIVDANGQVFPTVGTIHTHLSHGGNASPSDADVGYHAQNMPYKVYATIGFDSEIHPNYARIVNGQAVYSSLYGSLKGDGHPITTNEILSGYDLIQRIEKYNETIIKE